MPYVKHYQNLAGRKAAPKGESLPATLPEQGFGPVLGEEEVLFGQHSDSDIVSDSDDENSEADPSAVSELCPGLDYGLFLGNTTRKLKQCIINIILSPS